MNNKSIILFVTLLTASLSLFGQVTSNIQQPTSINGDGTNPAASAMLDVQATDKGMLVPRMTTVQRTTIASPATGLLVFDSDTGGFWFYNGGWQSLSGGTSYTAGTGIGIVGNTISNTGDLSATNEIQTLGLSGNLLSLSLGGGTADFSALASKWTLSGSNIYRATGNVGIGTSTPAASLEVENGAVLFKGATGGTPVSGAGTRLMWVPAKSAFRAGYINGSQWDESNIGNYSSVGGGFVNTASGTSSCVSGGQGNIASGYGAGVGGGEGNTAAGGWSFVGGGQIGTASGNHSFAGGGTGLLSKSYAEAVFGTYNTDYTPASLTSINATDRLFVIGNGTNAGARSNALTVLKNGNVGIGTATPSASAILDMQSTVKGVLVPRMTTAQRTAVASPATGLLVYDTSTGGFWFYNGTAWATIGAGGSGTSSSIADADNDTKIQTEESPNENIIRFDLGGTENMVLRKNVSGHARLELPSASTNTFIGQDVGGANTTGYSNTASGFTALSLNTIGFNNTANGYQALHDNTIGNNNTASGYLALYSNTTGGQNIANGYKALYSNTTGGENTASGPSSLYFNTIGFGNTASGSSSMFLNTSGSYNTASGLAALYSNTTGNSNTASGWKALISNTTGNHNIAIGVDALHFNTIGFSNVAIGKGALYNNNNRSNLVAVGDSALYYNGVGASAAFHATGNMAIGSKSLCANTTGASNTASGYQSLRFNTTGYDNMANGYQALYSNTIGFRNSASGTTALYQNTTGYENTANGANALSSNTTGISNTAVGYSANFLNGALNNTTCLGAYSGSVSNASNRIEIGNTSVSWIGGQSLWMTYSDARIKNKVQENVPGLDFITRLRPVTYHLDIHKQNEMCLKGKKEEGDWKEKYDIEQKRMTGFIAQEVEKAAQTIGYNFSGVEKATDELGMYSVGYAAFVVPLVKAVQEQQAEIETLIAENIAQKVINEAQQAENATLKIQFEKITKALQGAGIVVEK